MRQTAIVSGPGMYEVVIRSDKPESVNFRRWITGEVLPAIRRTGDNNPVGGVWRPLRSPPTPGLPMDRQR